MHVLRNHNTNIIYTYYYYSLLVRIRAARGVISPMPFFFLFQGGIIIIIIIIIMSGMPCWRPWMVAGAVSGGLRTV